MVKRQKQRSSKQDKKLLHFRQHPSAWQYHSPSLWLSKATAFSSTAHCLWRTSSAKPPKSCCYHLRRISCVLKYLSTEAIVKLVTSLILSRFDYCNSLLSGRPASSVHSLRRIQNCAARLIQKNTHIKLTPSHLCFSLSTGSQSNIEFSTK